MAFNKIIKSQINEPNNGDIAGFSRAFNAAILNSNFVETLQNQIVQNDGQVQNVDESTIATNNE